ncbi:methyltransferase domain-containing protein [Corynebacterium pseudokroppenstedtii]|uniref:Methyltransferase domain-containing protein n=1 Tax=Corynebacterium pseudokroppenstedtii TaxID=2804917 RepID=A0AAU0Q1C2_9CORY|nr:methyltransferase domain-containing protein [Corynebacterium pseudokroppenstedtii]MDU7504345.1 methyltransferase domain-containing protein [Corynebacterium kroppenstedtii]MBY0790831.1 methyltransferase domain-containing protein [Corynebacterium pseudokroppenstedtii]MCF6792644.1 methyltransferase domain-containing protein [Corynebacterium pseudokroppenstedtii]MCF8702585.1 methyltransferase domain-containing protein [Corynebacterium pseudokroppenstedtii]MCG2636101.1 methyltransferase domain-c
MLSDVLDVLSDPIDGSSLHDGGNLATLVSDTGHSYDVARQGYVSLVGGRGLRYKGDDASMIQAREKFLASGHFGPFVEAVTGNVQDVLDDAGVGDHEHPVVMEVGAGTGYYLAHTLDAVPGSRGIGIDVSVPAAKRIAGCHPRVGAVIADAWSRLPVKDKSIDTITVVFAPRNAEEFARVLTDEGQVVVLTAAPGHLVELREPLGIIDVEKNKVHRMIQQASGHLTPDGEPEEVEFEMNLGRDAIEAQVGMSPSARHIRPEDLKERIATLPDSMTVTARATVTRLKKNHR